MTPKILIMLHKGNFRNVITAFAVSTIKKQVKKYTEHFISVVTHIRKTRKCST